MASAANDKVEIASYVLAAFALLMVLHLGLLPALLAGLLVYRLVEYGARGLEMVGVLKNIGKIVLLLVIAVVVVSAITSGVIALFGQMTKGPESLSVLMSKMADIVATARSHLPVGASEYLPFNMDEWQSAVAQWLRENAKQLSIVGRDVGILLTQLIVGMIIGGLVALHTRMRPRRRPLTDALTNRTEFLDRAFHRIVFSQIRISALNTTLTGIFLALIMPMIGMPLPLTKTLIVVTFIAGLLPIIGNLISNTVITLVALSVSPAAAGSALLFLVLVHKLEYFINARIVGGEIRARAWEILVAMLVMEAAFGLPGVVAAPIYYAYLKDELSAKGLV
ncbi:MAG: AI-2E family transporter [Alphaproteobacteria bacterium]